MNRRFFIIGDTEMGRGDLMDDFVDDDQFVRFVEHISEVASDEVTLVLNGDVFDFLKMAFQDEYPRYITEEISLWKVSEVLRTHGKVFAALKKFLSLPHAKLIFIIGNHDPDFVWPKVQDLLIDSLGHAEKIQFVHYFEGEEFHIEHGNLIDPLFNFPYQRPVIEYKGKKILNLPLGSQIASQYLIHLKKEFSFHEKLYPQQEVFKKYPEYKKAINTMMRKHSLQIFLLDPFFHWPDPMYRAPYFNILEHIFTKGFDGIHDERFLNFRLLHKQFPKKKLYVLSHAHVLKDMQKQDTRYIILDCWRQELDVSGVHDSLVTPDHLESRGFRKKPKVYVEIELMDDKLTNADLKVFEPKNLNEKA